MRTAGKTTVGIAGLGAIGGAVARALLKGIDGYELIAGSDPRQPSEFKIPYVSFDELAEKCDLVIECLPPMLVDKLADKVFAKNKDLVIISTSALLMNPQILEQHKRSQSRIYVPSGALIGIDGVQAMLQMGIKSAKIASTKPPRGFEGAPYIVENKIDLLGIKTKTLLFEGNATEASKAFPANVNVAATLSLAGIGPAQTKVQIWADPETKSNSHEIEVESEFSRMTARVENRPDPANPKSSMLAAQSIVAMLKNLASPLIIL